MEIRTTFCFLGPFEPIFFQTIGDWSYYKAAKVLDEAPVESKVGSPWKLRTSVRSCGVGHSTMARTFSGSAACEERRKPKKST